MADEIAMKPPRVTKPVTIRKHPSRPGHWKLETEQWLPRPIDEVWSFFSDAHNLEELTPSLLRFEVLTPKPIPMGEGTLIDYKLRIRGVPVYWRTEISLWEPGVRFMDRQLRGPYRWWEHEHTFEASNGGTLCKDRVAYHVPGGPLAPLVHAVAVRRDVENIFRFRGSKLAELLVA